MSAPPDALTTGAELSAFLNVYRVQADTALVSAPLGLLRSLHQALDGECASPVGRDLTAEEVRALFPKSDGSLRSRTTINGWAKKGLFPGAYRANGVGSGWLFTPASIEAFREQSSACRETSAPKLAEGATSGLRSRSRRRSPGEWRANRATSQR